MPNNQYYIRRRYYHSLWKERALRFARSLSGRDRTAVEKKFAEEHPDRWDYFYVFGMQEETQHYVEETIRQIGELSDTGENLTDFLVPAIRLEWSAIAILRTPEYLRKKNIIDDKRFERKRRKEASWEKASVSG